MRKFLLLVACAGALRLNLRRHRSARRDTRPAAAPADPSAQTEGVEVPTRGTIVTFAAPVAALNLANFAMGSVDTAAVGRFGTTRVAARKKTLPSALSFSRRA